MEQKASARLLTGTLKHTALVLASARWQPIRFRIHFKMISFAFKPLNLLLRLVLRRRNGAMIRLCT